MSRTSLPRSTALNPLGSDFDRFLYAGVGDDRNGGLLSVISALARAGVDPWEQASILARLPVDHAARALSALLARLPVGPGGPVDLMALATHLVTLLPKRISQAEGGHQPEADGSAMAQRNRLRMALSFLACILLFLGMQRLFAPAPATAPTPAVTPALQPAAAAPQM